MIALLQLTVTFTMNSDVVLKVLKALFILMVRLDSTPTHPEYRTWLNEFIFIGLLVNG